jgi:UDP-N-acetylmuramoyl-tripeptide--D-alanyl-D-alanine ligase
VNCFQEQKIVIKIKLSLAKKILEGQLAGKDVGFHGVSIDSRNIVGGELFVAIKGPNFDGHDYVEQAFQNGAAAALVTQASRNYQGAVLSVYDTRLALGQLAAWYRQQFSIPILAVTGSCGKTTTKSMLASILSHCGLVHANPGTLNNDYGVPLTLLNMAPEHDYAVIEMGANHIGEIAYLSQITRPTVAAITLAAPVHLEGFGDLAGVAKGKGEIFSGLTDEGIAIINADDAYADYWRNEVTGHNWVSFGVSPEADVRAVDVSMKANSQPTFTLQTPKGSIHLTLPLLGEYNVVNALAAAAATYSIGIDLENIRKGLETVTPVAKRMVKRIGWQGIEIFDDTYNANPLAAEEALKVLTNGPGEKIFVLGEMGELGIFAEDYHRQLGQKAREYGVNSLYAVGDLARHTVDAFGDQGFHFPDQQELISRLCQDVKSTMRVLVKGSRSTRMERVVEALLHREC